MPDAAPTHRVNLPEGRPNSCQRGYDHSHRKWREAVLGACQGVCEGCRGAAAEHADHIVPLSKGGGWTLTNGQGLCPACHNAKTARERMGGV